MIPEKKCYIFIRKHLIFRITYSIINALPRIATGDAVAGIV